MASPTRIQQKSRPTKRPMWKGTFDLNGGTISTDSVPARTPKFDKKGYPAYKGLPHPVLTDLTIIDTTP